MNNRSVNIDVVKILVIIILASIAVYGFSGILVQGVFFSILFFLFLRSNNDIFWIAFFFIIVSSPIGLFYYKQNEWILALTSTVGISFKAMICIIIFLKYRIRIINAVKRSTVIDVFPEKYKLVKYYLFFLFVLGLYFGTNLASLFNVFQYTAGFLLILVVPKLFSLNDYYKFNRLIFVFTIIHTMLAFVDISTKGVLFNALTFGKGVFLNDDELIRITGGIFLALYSMVVSLHYLITGYEKRRKGFLWLTIIVSYIFILSSATRGWMLGSSILLIFYLTYYTKRVAYSLQILIPSLFLIAAIILLIPNPITSNLEASIDRFTTVESLAKGDLTAGGTASRWDVRGPKVLTRFNESPIVGFGYSAIAFEYFDAHVGNHSILLVGGVVGLLIVWGFVIYLIAFLFFLDRKTYYRGVFVFGMGLIAIMLIHSSSRSMISFFIDYDAAFLIALIFGNINALIWARSNHTKPVIL